MEKNPAFQSQPPFPWELELGVFLCICTLLLLSCGTMPPDDILEKSGPTALVFFKENGCEDNRSNAMRSNADEYYPGSDICILSPISPQGEITNLTAQYTRANQSQSRNYGAVADPETSYEGKKILFAMRENRGERWHICEMNLEGGDPTKLTDQSDGDDMDPSYLPNGQIMFTSTRPGIVDEYKRRGCPLLHVADRQADGRLINIRRISFNQGHDTNLIVHSSGRIFWKGANSLDKE